MFKTLFKLATVVGVLAASYQGYVHAFAFVVGRLSSGRQVEHVRFERQHSRTEQMAKEAARRYFGEGHWTTRPDVALHYNADRGVYLFAQKIAPPQSEDATKAEGKQLEFDLVAIILKTENGKSTKLITSRYARLDFNKRLGFDAKQDSEPMIIKHARLDGDVVIRDDRGTPDDPKDDMVASMPWIEYDHDALQVRTEAEVLLVDRDLRLTAVGLEIKLRPKTDPNRPSDRAPTGFEGAQSAVLGKNIDITFGDVGKTGVLPGAAKPRKSADGKLVATAEIDPKAAADAAAPAQEPTPLNIRCLGPMRIDLPNAPAPVEVGPPAPSAPTLVRFNRMVVVKRGKLNELPDQLDCDTLDLTLLPGDPPPPRGDDAKSAEPRTAGNTPGDAELAAKPGARAETGEKSLFGGLALRRAKASGHAVWLQMPSQNAKVRCIELIHSKDPLGGKNTTHFLGGKNRLMVVKEDVAAEGPDRGKVQNVTHVWCADATLIDDGQGGEGGTDKATLVANGPGLLESRAASKSGEAPPRGTPPDRTAVWQDQLWLKPELDAEGAIVGKVLVLKGSPRIQDRLQSASLDAAESIYVWFDEGKPAEAPRTATTLDQREVVPAAFVAPDPASPAARPQSRGMSIRRLMAVKDVHLVAPSKDQRARDWLEVRFTEPRITTSPPASAPAQPAAPSPAPAPTDEPPAATEAPAQSAAPAPKPEEPLMTASADTVRAWVQVGDKPAATTQPGAASSSLFGGSDSSYEIRDVQMRGGVVLHQDPSPGKKKGTDASGEVLVLRNEAQGKAIFDLYHHDPYSRKTRNVKPESMPPARVTTEEMSIEANLIGVNQSTNQAWAYGKGKLTQLTDRGLLTDRSPDAQAQAAEAGGADADQPRKRAGKVRNDKTPITITWDEKMTFEGVSVDPMDRPAAKAVFHKNAKAVMEDGGLAAGESITTYTDRPVPLAEFGKLTRKPKADPIAANSEDLPAEDEEPKPDLVLIECRGKAAAKLRKVDADRPVLRSMQVIQADAITYDRRSGGFIAPGPGVVFLYDRDNNDPSKPSRPGTLLDRTAASGRTIQPTSYQPGDDDRLAAGRRGAGPKASIPPLVLTQIKFNKEMRGRFGTGKQDDVTQQRWAEFFGGVETARAEVPGAETIFNYDRLPSNAYFMTSETLRVITEPPPPGADREAEPRHFLKAWDGATVTARNTTLQADVITYDSLNDLVYANALDGRTVQYAQQTGLGQPASPGSAKAVRMNPKTGAVDVADPSNIQLIDHRTGARPREIFRSEPELGAIVGKIAKPQAPRPRPTRPIVNPIEKKGFTGR